MLEWLGVLLWCVMLAQMAWGPGVTRRLVRFGLGGANAMAVLFLGWATISARAGLSVGMTPERIPKVRLQPESDRKKHCRKFRSAVSRSMSPALPGDHAH